MESWTVEMMARNLVQEKDYAWEYLSVGKLAAHEELSKELNVVSGLARLMVGPTASLLAVLMARMMAAH